MARLRSGQFTSATVAGTVTEPHDWPLEQSAERSLRPWYFRATGHLMARPETTRNPPG
jgi:hypothetical protein